MVADAERGELAGEPVALLGGRGGEALAQRLLRVFTRMSRPVSGSTSQSSPTFGSSCSRGSRISTASTSWRPASSSSGRRQSRGPRKSETTTTSERWRASAPARLSASPSEVAPTRSSGGSARSAESRPIRPSRPCLGGSARGSSSPKVTTPSLFPRRVATWPSAIATPSATSALRRSAVPNCIEGEVSSTSQVTSTRSARCSRTCGSPVRAVTFQSMLPDVVARHVGADLRELGAVAVQRARGSRRRAGPRCGGRCRRRAPAAAPSGSGPGPGRSGVRLGPEQIHAAVAPRRGSGRSAGPGTAPITESRIVSGLTSSASAW